MSHRKPEEDKDLSHSHRGDRKKLSDQAGLYWATGIGFALAVAVAWFFIASAH